MSRKLMLITGVMAATIGSTATAETTKSDIKDVVNEQLSEFVESPQFENHVEEAIYSFVEKQEQKKKAQAKAGAKAEAEEKGKKLENLPMISEEDHVRGDRDAEFTLITYTDYECPYCNRFHDFGKTFEANNDDVNWVNRHFPLSMHNPGAQKQAEAAECAAEQGGDDAFWAYTDLIMERTEAGGNGFPIENLAPLAAEVGLDKSEFETCFEEERYAEKVKLQYRRGIDSGVTGTPGNFLVHNPTGAVQLIRGAQPPQSMQKTLGKMKSELE